MSKEKLLKEIEGAMFIETDYDNRIVLVEDVRKLINEHCKDITAEQEFKKLEKFIYEKYSQVLPNLTYVDPYQAVNNIASRLSTRLKKPPFTAEQFRQAYIKTVGSNPEYSHFPDDWCDEMAKELNKE